MTRADLLLINPNRLKPPVAPIAVDYLADALCLAMPSGFELGFLDLCLSDDPQADLDAHCERSPGLVGITVRNTDDCYLASGASFMPQLRRLTEDIRARFAGPIVLGGSGFSVMPEAILQYCGLEWGVIGDGEWALAALMGAVREGAGDPTRIPGIVHRTADGRFQRVPWKPGPLASLPAFRRALVENGRYFRKGGQVGVETKRGCTQGCIYCADPLGKGRTCRLRPAAKVADEVENLLRQGVEVLHLCDSEFNVPAKHAHAISKEFVEHGLGGKVNWYTYASPKPFDARLADAMRAAGCVGIDFGVDSGDARMLRRLGRDFTPEDIAATAKACRDAGIVFMFDLLLGGPGETRDSIARTIELMKNVEPDRVGVSLGVRLYPGTALAREVLRAGPLAANPNLRGNTEDNDSLLMPVFYLSEGLGEGAEEYVRSLVGSDRRFFLPGGGDAADYNYNENRVLVDALARGHRGAYWDILRRLQEGLEPLGED